MSRLGEGRHASVAGVARWFTYDHLPDVGYLHDVSQACQRLAEDILYALPDSPELTVGLRHLLQAKDCFVRAALEAHEADQAAEVEEALASTTLLVDRVFGTCELCGQPVVGHDAAACAAKLAAWRPTGFLNEARALVALPVRIVLAKPDDTIFFSWVHVPQYEVREFSLLDTPTGDIVVQGADQGGDLQNLAFERWDDGRVRQRTLIAWPAPLSAGLVDALNAYCKGNPVSAVDERVDQDHGQDPAGQAGGE